MSSASIETISKLEEAEDSSKRPPKPVVKPQYAPEFTNHFLQLASSATGATSLTSGIIETNVSHTLSASSRSSFTTGGAAAVAGGGGGVVSNLSGASPRDELALSSRRNIQQAKQFCPQLPSIGDPVVNLSI